jgi:hypothetical protein
VAPLGEPTEKPPQCDESTIDGGNGLTVIPAKVIPKIGDVPHGDTLDRERLTVRRREPPGELSHVLGEGSPGVRRQIVGVDELGKKGRSLNRCPD